METLIIALGGLLASMWGLTNAFRRQAKIWITYAVFLALLYISGHIVIAWANTWGFSFRFITFEPHRYLSILTSLWTLGFSLVAALGIWVFGGVPLDATIALTAMSNEQFEAFMRFLGDRSPDDLERHVPSWFRPVARCLHHGGMTRVPVRILLRIWRGAGQQFLPLLKKSFMIAQLLGLYFLYIPPSNSWRLFWATGVAFAGYAISGVDFNWKLWRQVCILTMIINVVSSTLIGLYPSIPQFGSASISGGLFGHIFSREFLLTATFFALVVLFATRSKGASAAHHG